MEAFISPLSFTQFGDHPDEQDEYRHSARRRSKNTRRRNSRNRARDYPVSRGREDFFGRGRAMEDDFFRDDPFRGF
ncbi:hypothetical protein G6O67_001111 [Ophiocordyceps sinensis]|nr:hypothetical protein G6O67_001111 [Ophiocordyceps sinensis]